MLIEIKSTMTIYDLLTTYPNIKEIMVELGFLDIVKPGMLQSVGRFMTIEKGSKMKNIGLELIKKTFYNHGYLIIDK
ncbi:MAG: DUF1858 domain-containing protein [Clostridiales bacterium]|nr:DUF1858 domain-containing protein [Clostridiales bacterium]